MYNMRCSTHHHIMDDVVGVAHSSSDALLESEDDDEDESSSPCSSESSTGVGVTFFWVPAGVAGEDLYQPLEKSEGNQTVVPGMVV